MSQAIWKRSNREHTVWKLGKAEPYIGKFGVLDRSPVVQYVVALGLKGYALGTISELRDSWSVAFGVMMVWSAELVDRASRPTHAGVSRDVDQYVELASEQQTFTGFSSTSNDYGVQ